MSSNTTSSSSTGWFVALADSTSSENAVHELLKRWKAATSAFNEQKFHSMDLVLGPSHCSAAEPCDRCSSRIDVEDISQKRSSLLRLWKSSSNLLLASPISILSPRHGLLYEPTRPHSMDRVSLYCHLWPESFCQAFYVLVCHPIWGKDAKKLTAALQVAAVCRLDDRRPWDFGECPSPFKDMQKLREVVSTRRDHHLNDLCSEITAERRTKGKSLSLDFIFFCRIGSYTKRDPSAHMTNNRRHGPPHLVVNIADLEAITDAINTNSSGERLKYTYSEVVAEVSRRIHFQSSFPAGNRLKEAHIRSFSNELRMAEENLSSDTSMPVITTVTPGAISRSSGGIKKKKGKGKGKHSKSHRWSKRASGA